MTDEKMVLELARIDGITLKATECKPTPLNLITRTVVMFFRGGRRVYQLPDYLNSHDALQRVIDGMDDEEFKCSPTNYHEELITIIIRDGGQYSWLDVHKATPRQKAEAILKAYGRWT